LACEPGPLVQYENATSQRVTIYKEGRYQFALEPHETKGIATLRQYWLPNIKVVTEDGRILLEDHITWDEMRNMGSRIVITDPANNAATPTSTTLPTN
jgi:hypothetical protein